MLCNLVATYSGLGIRGCGEENDVDVWHCMFEVVLVGVDLIGRDCCKEVMLKRAMHAMCSR
jgi:hypothetical protein